MKELVKKTILPVKDRKAFNSLKLKRAAVGKLRGIWRNKPYNRRISRMVAECFIADEMVGLGRWGEHCPYCFRPQRTSIQPLQTAWGDIFDQYMLENAAITSTLNW